MIQSHIFYIVLAAAIAVALAFFMYGFRSKLSTQKKWFFGILRFFTLFILFLLFINPTIENTTYETVKPKLYVAVDNSSSIQFLEKNTAVNTLVQSLQNDEALNNKFDIRYYRFGREVLSLDSLSFDEKQTHIDKALHTLQQLPGEQSSAVMLITDGNATYGSEYTYLTESYPHNIFPVAVGDTTRHQDFSVTRINTNRYAYIKNEFPVEVFVNYTGPQQAETVFEIRRGSQLINQTSLVFDSGSHTQTLTVYLPADKVGVQQYTATVRAVADEKNTDNNTRPFAVEVIDDATQVLLVSAMAHPDLGALQRSIMSNEQRKVTLTTPEQALDQLEGSQLVIFYQPDSRFETILEATARLKINQLYITGLQTDWTFLNKTQDHFKKWIDYPEEEVQAALNTGYAAFTLEDIGFSDFPPLKSSLGDFESDTPVDVLLTRKIQGIDVESPLMFSIEQQQLKTAVFDAEGIWKWRAHSYVKNGDFTAFDSFIGNFVQYLSSTKSRSRLEVTSESFYHNTEPVKLYAQYFDKNFEVDRRASLQITVKNTETEATETFPMLLRNNYYEVNLSSLPAATYDYTVSVADENMSKSGRFQIIAYDIEQQFLNPDLSRLTQLAEKTSGQHYFLDDAVSVLQDLKGDNRFVAIQKSIQKNVPLLDWNILLFILVGLLAVEWFGRKYSGLI